MIKNLADRKRRLLAAPTVWAVYDNGEVSNLYESEEAALLGRNLIREFSIQFARALRREMGATLTMKRARRMAPAVAGLKPRTLVEPFRGWARKKFRGQRDRSPKLLRILEEP